MSNNGTRVPILLSGADLKALPLGPEEAFVVSRVDGRADERDIAMATSLSGTLVSQHLSRLHSLGAIRFVGEPDQAPSSASPSSDGVDVAAATSATSPRYVNAPASTPAASVDVSNPAQVALLIGSLESMDHYQTLGLTRNADKREIKEAYFSLVGRFHPDQYYGQELGDLKDQLASVFQRLTEAHETLTRKRRRAAYDAALPEEKPVSTQRAAGNRGHVAARADESVNTSSQSSEHPHIATQPSPAQSRPPIIPSPPIQVTSPRALPPPPRFSSPEIPQAPKITHTPGSATAPSSAPADSESRRRALAMRLRASGSRPAVGSGSQWPKATSQRAPSIPPMGHRGWAHYLAAAKQSEAAGDPIGTVNSLRLATSLAPEDPRLKRLLDDAEFAADRQLAPQHIERAQEFERRGELQQAANYFGRAARGKSDPLLFAQAAKLGLQAGDDLKQASLYAKKAVESKPSDPHLRLLLGRIYSAAGMETSAIAELERAKKLAPNNPEIQECLKQTRRSS